MVGSLQRARSEDEKARSLGGIAHVSQMLRRMEHLLSFTSKLQRGIVRAIPEPLSLRDLVLPQVRELEGGEPGEAGFSVSDFACEVVADRKVVEVAVGGLLQLALKFRNRGTIEIDATERDANVAFRVEFTGDLPATAMDEMAFVERGLGPDGKLRLAAGPALVRALVAEADMTLGVESSIGRTVIILEVPRR